MTDYERIEKAIVYIQKNFKDQPDLDAVACQVYLSPFHFQKLFKNWAGVSPKKFLQFISVKYAKDLLKQNLSLRDVSFWSAHVFYFYAISFLFSLYFLHFSITASISSGK